MARRPRGNEPSAADGGALLPYNIELFKEVEDSYLGPLPERLEAVQAEASLYGWWWRFLKANPNYPPRGVLRDDPARAAVYQDFGRLGDSFQDWWQMRGRRLFHERGDIPLVRLLERRADPRHRMATLSLVVEVPLNISREGIIEQLNFVLDRFHPGDALLRHEHSTARWPIYPRPRYRRDKLPTLLAVWEARQRDPQPTFWEIGQELGLAAWLKVDENDRSPAASDVRKTLGDKVQRLYEQAEKLVHNAALGQFPRDDRKVRSTEVKLPTP